MLYSFTGKKDGSNPQASLIFDHGVLYGTTILGGSLGQGKVFKVNATTGAETVLYNFALGADGSDPNSTLNLQDGQLYGTTAGGGTSNQGIVFAINVSTGAETVLHNFTGGPTAEARSNPG